MEVCRDVSSEATKGGFVYIVDVFCSLRPVDELPGVVYSSRFSENKSLTHVVSIVQGC